MKKFFSMFIAVALLAVSITMPVNGITSLLASGTCGTCTWEIGLAGNLTIKPTTGSSGTLASGSSATDWGWNNYRSQIKTVTVEPGVAGEQSMSHMFYECSSLTSADLSGLNTSNVRAIEYTFYECSSLSSVNLSGLNTSNVTNMEYMFASCKALTSLDLSSFNTSNVTGMAYMFLGCSSLLSLNLSSFNTPNVMDITSMFADCSSLTSLNVPNFNTSKATSMVAMFQNCSSLTSLDLSSFNTSNVTDMSSAFYACSSLTSLDLSSFNTSNVRDMFAMSYGCSSLTSIDLSSFDTSKVTDMSYMFQNCSSLASLDLSSFNTSKVTAMDSAFSSCSALSEVQLGTAFKFVGTGSALPTPPATADSTWTNVSKKLTYSAADLQAGYDGSTMSGTWAWTVVATITYAATTGGNVSPASEKLASVTGAATGAVATPAAGYHFVNWTKNGVAYSDDASIHPAPVYNNGDVYTANFAADDPVTITYTATTGGSVSLTSETLAPATGIATGSKATAKDGYRFVNWTSADGNVVSSDATYVPDKVAGLNAAASYTANFEKDNSTTADNVSTGDNSNISLWFTLLLVSGGMLTMFGVNKKHKERNSK